MSLFGATLVAWTKNWPCKFEKHLDKSSSHLQQQTNDTVGYLLAVLAGLKELMVSETARMISCQNDRTLLPGNVTVESAECFLRLTAFVARSFPRMFTHNCYPEPGYIFLRTNQRVHEREKKNTEPPKYCHDIAVSLFDLHKAMMELVDKTFLKVTSIFFFFYCGYHGYDSALRTERKREREKGEERKQVRKLRDCDCEREKR